MSVTVAVVAVAVLVGSSPVGAEETVLVIDGRGWGHGVGMSQEGARTMGVAGASTEEILAKFYPGTEKGTARATVRVLVLESKQVTETFTFPAGGELRAVPSGDQPPGFPVAVAPGDSVEVIRSETGFRVIEPGRGGGEAAATRVPMRLISAQDGRSTVATLPNPTSATTSPAKATATPTTTPVGQPATTTSTAMPSSSTSVPLPPPSTVPAPPATPVTPARTMPPVLWAVPRGDGTTVIASTGRRYRGRVEAGADAKGNLRLVNHIDVESYLRGMGEVVDPSWPPAALRAQAVAARTYALRASGAAYDLCDDDRCQVYLGQSAEYEAMDRAVADTRNQVLLFDGALASTFYSANGGGVSATAEEGFGAGGVSYPYLRSSPYPTADPDPWTEQAGLADVGRRFAYPGRLGSARVSATGPSGRATEVTLDGDVGSLRVDGRTFASRLGLKSTLFVLRADVGRPPLLPELPIAPVLEQRAGLLLGVEPGDAKPAVAASRARPARPWLPKQVPILLMALVADAALMAFRAGRRSRAGSLPALQEPEPQSGAG